MDIQLIPGIFSLRLYCEHLKRVESICQMGHDVKRVVFRLFVSRAYLPDVTLTKQFSLRGIDMRFDEYIKYRLHEYFSETDLAFQNI